jgi:hypothetical protein
MEGKNNILIDDHHGCKATAMTPQELLKHLKDEVLNAGVGHRCSAPGQSSSFNLFTHCPNKIK